MWLSRCRVNGFTGISGKDELAERRLGDLFVVHPVRLIASGHRTAAADPDGAHEVPAPHDRKAASHRKDREASKLLDCAHASGIAAEFVRQTTRRAPEL